MAILELQNAGALDAVPGTLVTAFGVDGTDPTLGSNVAVITAAQSKSVTTSWAQYSVSVTVPSNSKNLICALWTNVDPLGANEYINVAEAGLYQGSVIQPWLPRHTSQELALCQRYFEKSFEVDTGPAYGLGYYLGALCLYQAVAGANPMYANCRWAVRKRADPTITFYNPVNAGAEAVNYNAGGDLSSTAVQGTAREQGMWVAATGTAGSAAGNLNGVHWAAAAEL